MVACDVPWRESSVKQGHHESASEIWTGIRDRGLINLKEEQKWDSTLREGGTGYHDIESRRTWAHRYEVETSHESRGWLDLWRQERHQQRWRGLTSVLVWSSEQGLMKFFDWEYLDEAPAFPQRLVCTHFQASWHPLAFPHVLVT